MANVTTEMVDEAMANIRADYRAGIVHKAQFQKEMLIMARARQQALANPTPETRETGQ